MGLLLPCHGDKGNTGHEVTVKGTPILKSFNAEGNSIVNYSGFFNGTDAHLSIANHADFNFERTDPFSVEAYGIFLGSSTGTIIGRTDVSVSYRGWHINVGPTGLITVILRNTNTTNDILVTSSLAISLDNRWGHILVTYDGSSTAAGINIFINGVKDTSITIIRDGLSATMVNTKPVLIGKRDDGLIYSGYLSGVAVHNVVTETANFTPPKTIAEMTNDANTVLFIDFTDMTQGSTPATLTDSSVGGNGGAGHTVTNVSSKVSGCTFWWDGAFDLNGTTDYLTVPDHTDWDFGTGDLTLSLWYMFMDTDPAVFFGFLVDDENRWSIYWSSNTLSFHTFIGGAQNNDSFSFTPVLNRMYHIEVNRTSGNIRCLIDGVAVASPIANSDNLTPLSSTLGVGALNLEAGWTNFANGLLGELVFKNTGGHTSGFTPSTAKATSDANTKLLLQPSGNTAIGGENHDVTLTDGIVLSQESDTGFGQSSKLNGTSNYLEISDSEDWDLYIAVTDKAIFGYGYTDSNVSMTNLVSNTGVVATDTTGVGTARCYLAAAGYGGDKAIFGYGYTGVNVSMTNLVSNTGVVATDTTGVGTARWGLAAAGYGGDKAIFGYGFAAGSNLSMTNLVSNTGVVATDTTGVGTARRLLAAAGYGGDKAIFGYGFDGTNPLSMTNLVSNTGVVATDTTGVGTARRVLAAAGYGTDKAIFGYGLTGSYVSMTNLVSNTGVVATDTTGVGTARQQLAAAGYGG
jgi:hypothetical protein